MKTILVLLATLLLLLAPVAADSSVTFLERYSTTTGLSVYEVVLDSNSTGYVSFTSPALFGRLYAIDWYSASTLRNNNTIVITATAPYSRILTSYNITMDKGNTTYPRDGANEIALRSPLTFTKANGTSAMDATLYIYMTR